MHVSAAQVWMLWVWERICGCLRHLSTVIERKKHQRNCICQLIKSSLMSFWREKWRRVKKKRKKERNTDHVAHMVTMDSGEGVAVSGFQRCFILMWVDQDSSFARQRTEREEAILRERQKRGKEGKKKKQQWRAWTEGRWPSKGSITCLSHTHIHTHSKLGMIAHREHTHTHTQTRKARTRVCVFVTCARRPYCSTP